MASLYSHSTSRPQDCRCRSFLSSESRFLLVARIFQPGAGRACEVLTGHCTLSRLFEISVGAAQPNTICLSFVLVLVIADEAWLYQGLCVRQVFFCCFQYPAYKLECHASVVMVGELGGIAVFSLASGADPRFHDRLKNGSRPDDSSRAARCRICLGISAEKPGPVRVE